LTFKPKTFAYVSMMIVVFAWGFEYVAAKAALDVIEPLALICVKFSMGFVVLMAVKLVRDRRFPFALKDLPMLVACTFFGELLYFACEYGAMDYLPVSVISIVLAFVPAVSVVIEYFLYKRKANLKIVVGIAVGVIGVAFVIGGNMSVFLVGAGIGYLLIFGAVFSWNIYNFATAGLARKYKPLDLTVYQTICTSLLALPFLLHSLPPVSAFSSEVIGALCFLGFVSEGIGFLFYVNAVSVLGPTPCALFSNMLPVTTTFFGWMFLNERILPVQIVGGVVVVAAGVVVIREKDKLDAGRLKAGGQEGQAR
jgi:drug/metabolite transporter (DMT)-like permease